MGNNKEEYENICGYCKYWDYVGFNFGYCYKPYQFIGDYQTTKTEETCIKFELKEVFK